MSLRDSFIGELKHEASLTKKILERVPWDKKDWKPHEKSMTLGRLATHIAETHHWITDILSADEFDFDTRTFSSYTAASTEEVIKIFTGTVEAAMNALSNAPEEEFEKKWAVKRGGRVIMEPLKKVAIRGWGLSHTYHHRGQLTVFLRLLDIAVPGMYGPSADEK